VVNVFLSLSLRDEKPLYYDSILHPCTGSDMQVINTLMAERQQQGISSHEHWRRCKIQLLDLSQAVAVLALGKAQDTLSHALYFRRQLFFCSENLNPPIPCLISWAAKMDQMRVGWPPRGRVDWESVIRVGNQSSMDGGSERGGWRSINNLCGKGPMQCRRQERRCLIYVKMTM